MLTASGHAAQKKNVALTTIYWLAQRIAVDWQVSIDLSYILPSTLITRDAKMPLTCYNLQLSLRGVFYPAFTVCLSPDPAKIGIHRLNCNLPMLCGKAIIAAMADLTLAITAHVDKHAYRA